MDQVENYKKNENIVSINHFFNDDDVDVVKMAVSQSKGGYNGYQAVQHITIQNHFHKGGQTVINNELPME